MKAEQVFPFKSSHHTLLPTHSYEKVLKLHRYVSGCN